MASATPTGTGTVPPPANLLESLKQGKKFQGFEYKPGMVVDNATYGRVRTTVCYADRREEKLDQMRQYYAQNKDFMNNAEATHMQQEMGKLQNSINPNQQVASSGLTASQQAYDVQQAENWADIKKMQDDPIYGALRGAGVSKKTAGNVSVLIKGIKEARGFKTKPEELKEKIGNKPPFKLPPYQ